MRKKDVWFRLGNKYERERWCMV